MSLKNSSPHRSIWNGGPGVILQVLEPIINFTIPFLSFPFICKTHFHLVPFSFGSKGSFICCCLHLNNKQIRAYNTTCQAVIWLENSFRNFHVFYFDAGLHKHHQRCNQPLRCTYIKLDSSLNVDYFKKRLYISRWKEKPEACFYFFSFGETEILACLTQ